MLVVYVLISTLFFFVAMFSFPAGAAFVHFGFYEILCRHRTAFQTNFFPSWRENDDKC